MSQLANGILSQVQGLAKPLFLAAVIIVGLYFLAQRQFIRILELGLVGILAGVLIFQPSVLQTISQAVGGAL